MGWAGGTRMMTMLIESFQETITTAGDEQTISFWQKIIKEFEDDDWDCQDECVGLDRLWDEAYGRGYFRPDGLCPYSTNTKEYVEWQDGKRES